MAIWLLMGIVVVAVVTEEVVVVADILRSVDEESGGECVLKKRLKCCWRLLKTE